MCMIINPPVLATLSTYTHTHRCDRLTMKSLSAFGIIPTIHPAVKDLEEKLDDTGSDHSSPIMVLGARDSEEDDADVSMNI